MIKSFTIIGQPVAKQRPRASVIAGFAHIYTPEETISYENLVKMSYRNDCGGFMFPPETPLMVFVDVYKKMPKKFYNTKGKLTEKGELALQGKILPLTKPDLDNLLKSILDALNKVAYDDDKCIANITIQKRFDERDYVNVRLISFDEKEEENGENT